MSLQKNETIKTICSKLRKDMIDYIADGDEDYTIEQVDECMSLLNNYLDKLDNISTREAGMAIVKETVLALNQLNETCEHALIETGQREDIAEVLILASKIKGFNEAEEDITEDWREW